MEVPFTLDGRAVVVDVEPRRMLSDALREDLGETGVHLGCEHGVCGTCTVLVDGEPVRACLQLAAQVADREVRTVASLGGPDGELDPLQEAFSAERGLQCGFCTPGFLVLLRAALDEDPTVVDDDARLDSLLASNLCRCTGYDGIRRAARRARDAERPM